MVPTFQALREFREQGGFHINYLRGTFHQKHAFSTIEGNGITNTMTQAHLEGSYTQMHRNQEGTKSIQKILRKDMALHNPLPHLCILRGEADSPF